MWFVNECQLSRTEEEEKEEGEEEEEEGAALVSAFALPMSVFHHFNENSQPFARLSLTSPSTAAQKFEKYAQYNLLCMVSCRFMSRTKRFRAKTRKH